MSRRPEETARPTRYVDLAPTDEADPSGVYSAALTEATSNPRVMNIALTGPYGSGKSSIIKSFLKGYSRPVLQISLAAFLPDAALAGHRVTRQEIERSILQQMLYGADANRLPLSRFKRIQAPGRSAGLASLFIALGLIACWHLVQKRDAIMSGTYFSPLDLTNWFNLLTFAIGAAFLWRVVYQIRIASFGISLKSLSLKDIELTPTAATEESILNRHLDEIIYFFQSTKYDLVVIEDLDRFDNADIFVTLREINSLINANSGVKRPVRFLYAIRDDMFVNTDRTKFFEFLIPVIPIINSSNSIDKVLEQGKRLSLEGRLNSQFLREVSRYLNDLRLIQNIFNEYAIYYANLETDGEANLDASKLLAVLIYKNVFPSDFENLHRGKGNLAEVLRSHDRCIEAIEARYATEISRLEKLIDQGAKQLPQDLTELRRIYAMSIIELAPDNYSSVGTNHNSFIPLSQLAKGEKIEEFLNSSQLIFRGYNIGQHHIQMSNFPAVAEAGKMFKSRKAEIERKSATFKDETFKSIRALRAKLKTVRMMPFNEIIRQNSEELDALFDGFGESSDLARFLVLEGYLDDTYYQYTSLFHKGRLSPNDNKYLIRIRSFSNPDPDFQIDNPKEVITAMRDEDFSRNYVLNVKLVDFLLSAPSSYAEKLKQFYDFLSGNFDSCETFLTAYYARGVAVPALIAGLTRAWPGFVQAAISSSANLTHVARIMSHLPAQQLTDATSKHPALRKFVSESLPDILALGIDFPPERLELLDVKITDLSALEAHPGVMRVLFGGGLYELSIDNLSFIFRSVLHLDPGAKPSTQNYTLVLEADSEPLFARIEGSFGEYLNDVLLQLPDNHLESVPAIQRVIEREDVEFESVVRFLEKQTALLPSADEVPQKYQAVLFEIGKIEPTWQNCLSFLLGENFDATILTEFLNRDTTLTALSREAVPDGDDALPLRTFIVGNNGLNDNAYAAFVRALPRNRKGFPADLSAEKMKILVDLERVNFSAANLAHLNENSSLSVTFVKNNLEEFFQVESECDLDDDFRENLLKADITDGYRLKILRSMDLGLLQGLPSRASVIGQIIARTGVVVDNLGADAARAIIVNSRPLEKQIMLFNMLHNKFDNQQVREILQLLPDPLPDIKPGWAIPTIKGSEVNVTFVTWLKTRGFISSWKQGGFWDNDIRMHLFRK